MEISTHNSLDNQQSGSFGSMLKQARERKKLTIEAVSEALFIKQRQLEALEAEDFNLLPQQTFSRAFAVKYGKFLGLDGDTVAKSFDAAYPNEMKVKSAEDIDSPLRPMGTLHREGRRNIRFNPFLAIGVALVIGLAMFLFRTVIMAEDKQNAPKLVENDITSVEQQQGAALTNTTTATTNNSLVGASGSAINIDNNTPTTNDNSGTLLELWVRGETTISVVDATGNTLLSGKQGRGGYALNGKPPFSIEIDKVNNVSLDMNKQPVQIKDYAKNNKARFQISP